MLCALKNAIANKSKCEENNKNNSKATQKHKWIYRINDENLLRALYFKKRQIGNVS